MKRFMLSLLCFLLVINITACTPVNLSTASSVELVNYPGLTWGMTPQEVLGALGLTESQVQKSEDGNTLSLGYLPEGSVNVFGLAPKAIIFRFWNSDSSQNLSEVTVLYEGRTEETVNALKEGLSNQYGPLKDTVVLGTALPISSSLEENVFQNKSSTDEFYWVSSQKIKDIWSAEELAQVQSKAVSQGQDYYSNTEYWNFYVETAPVAYVYLDTREDNPYSRMYPEGASVVTLNGSTYTGINQDLS